MHGNDDRRTVLIHGQTLRKDQIARLKTLKVIPSLFPMHTPHWGDWHRESVLGPERAAFHPPGMFWTPGLSSLPTTTRRSPCPTPCGCWVPP